jgi:hypothetical protein
MTAYVFQCPHCGRNPITLDHADLLPVHDQLLGMEWQCSHCEGWARIRVAMPNRELTVEKGSAPEATVIEVRSARLALLIGNVPSGLLFDLPKHELELATFIQNDVRSLPSLIQEVADALALMDECDSQFTETSRITREINEKIGCLIKRRPIPGDELAVLNAELAIKVGDHRFRLMNWKSAARRDVEQLIWDFRVAMSSVKKKLKSTNVMQSRVSMMRIEQAIGDFDALYPFAKERRDIARHPTDDGNTPMQTKYQSVSGPIDIHSIRVQSPGMRVQIGGTFDGEAVSTGKGGITSIQLGEVIPNLVRVMDAFYAAWRKS